MIIPPNAKPMVMTSENAASIREETKTETRRVMRMPRGLKADEIDTWYEIEPGLWEAYALGGGPRTIKVANAKPVRARYKTGDLVYIAEPYQISEEASFPAGECHVVRGWYGGGDNFSTMLTAKETAKFRARKFPYRRSPGRFMYRSLARTVQEIEEVRAERLQEITLGGIAAEGWPDAPPQGELISLPECWMAKDEGFAWWIKIWNAIHAKDGHDWDANDWVFVYRLKKWEGAA